MPKLVAAAEIASLMEGAEGFRVLNHPARVRTRYALLRALHERRLNAFDAYRGRLDCPGRGGSPSSFGLRRSTSPH